MAGRKTEKRRRHNAQCGSSLVEATAAICILFLVFFAMFQIYQWCMARFFCRYSAFYGSKGMALGYQPQFALRSARVAAISISGRNTGSRGENEADAESYMTGGDGSGVSYEYWHPQRSSDPWLYFSGNRTPGDVAECRVRMVNMPLVVPGIAPFLGISENPEPSVKVETVNYSQIFLEE